MLSEEDIARLREENEKRDAERRESVKPPENPFWLMWWRFLQWKF